MIDVDLLRSFCDPSWVGFDAPCVYLGDTWACDGTVLVWVEGELPGVGAPHEKTPLEKWERCFEETHGRVPLGWVPLPELDPAYFPRKDCDWCSGSGFDPAACRGCDGEGEQTCPHCRSEYACPECDGEGTIIQHAGAVCAQCRGRKTVVQDWLRVHSPSGLWSPALIERLSFLPEVRLAVYPGGPQSGPVAFVFDGGAGVAMTVSERANGEGGPDKSWTQCRAMFEAWKREAYSGQGQEVTA